MKKILFVISLLCAFCFIHQRTSAQTPAANYDLLLKTGIIQPQENTKDFIQTDFLSRKNSFEERCYVLMQFYQIPNQKERDRFAQEGIILSSYIPHNTYMASIPLSYDKSKFLNGKIRSIIPMDSRMKIHPDVAADIFVNPNSDVQIEIVVKCFDGIDLRKVEEILRNENAEILNRYEPTGIFTIRTERKFINQIASLPFVFYIEPAPPPSTPDDTKGRSLHRSNFINSDFVTGLHYDGTGVSAAIADDGTIGPHIDYQGRLTQFTAVDNGSHGDMTSGILMGAGNLDPNIKGMGTGAHLYMYDIGIYPQIIDAVLHLNTLGIVITSTSYSQGCNEYTSDTELGDQQIHENAPLIHCFSAGNRNGSDCGYGAGTQWGNISGGYKMGKNVIACGNLDAYGNLNSSSSRGPASDGRIKPDICANGEGQLSTDAPDTWQVGGGTSAASPGVAGVLTQLYQAYKDLNGGNNPESGLIKACILNTATDLGNPGPDYKFGWGHINARRAYNVLKENRYVIDSLDQGQTNTHVIAVPAGVYQLKVMVYWPDYQGNPLASKSLVNDINIQITDPLSAIYLPLVLNSYPDTDSLNANAKQGVDTLNNMEQVVIANPPAGDYTVSVNGFSIPQGPQRYFLVYEFFDPSITITYPNGGEGFVPTETEWLRWDTYGDTGTFAIDYSTDNGLTWSNLSPSVSGNARQFAWTISGVTPVTGEALIRITRGAYSDVSDTAFSIVNVPTGLTVSFSCPDSLGLTWNSVSGAGGYEVYKLSAKYMDPIGTSATNSFVVTPNNPSVTDWFSVSAVLPNGMHGRRAVAIKKPTGTFNCPLAVDGDASLVSPPSGNYRDCASNSATPISMKIKNTGLNPISNFNVKYQVNFDPVVAETFTGTINAGDSAVHTFSSTVDLSVIGTYNVKMWIELTGDLNIYNDADSSFVTVISGGTASAPVAEDFESGIFPPASWVIENPDNSTTWQLSPSIVGSIGDTTQGAMINNYSYNDVGQQDALATIMVDLTDAISADLAFDVAYAPFAATFIDTLRIDVSTDCGKTYQTTGYKKWGLILGTIGSYQTSTFQPTAASQWRTDIVNLTSYVGNTILLKFINITGYGNNLYLDNINIRSIVSVNDVKKQGAGVDIYPNPSTGIFNIVFKNISSSKAEIKITDVYGRTLMQMNENIYSGNQLSLDLSQFARGIYFLHLNYGEGSSQIETIAPLLLFR